MDTYEVKTQAARITKFRALEERAAQIRRALDDMKEPKVLTSGPFTGNTRESRRVQALRLSFSPTQGGAPAVEITLKDLNISANGFGMWLERELRCQLEKVQAEMEKI